MKKAKKDTGCLTDNAYTQTGMNLNVNGPAAHLQQLHLN